ncbi:MAG TPA: hypothetical protein VFU71_19850, partial [Burkholderiaceae bacterium]|nr:hypothetical protein [Burkholderiaceae bacterium]
IRRTRARAAVMRATPWLASNFVSRDLARRDLGLDALRGLMILGMVVVNHPPPALPVYSALAHVAWHGWTLADVIFPGFLFAVGASIRLTLCDPRGEPLPADMAIYLKIARRFALLMVLNFLLVNFPYYFAGAGGVDFTGTLALIAWCSSIVALIVLWTRRSVQIALLAAGLLVQWAALALLPVPGHGAGLLTPEANAARYLDELLFTFGAPRSSGSVLLMGLPTLGAVTTTLLGALTAPLVQQRDDVGAPWAGLLGGLALMLLGQAWQQLLPINMTLWTGSYSVFMAGIALALFALLHWIAGHAARGRWLRPLQVAGANALFLYVFAQCLQRLLVYGRIRDDSGSTVRLRHFIHDQYFAPALTGEFGSLVFALLFYCVCYLASLVLYRRRVFLKL